MPNSSIWLGDSERNSGLKRAIMTSQKQITTNRENAKNSSGPRTQAGKVRSSQNARKHGLYATQVVTLGEDPEAFEAFREDLHISLKPVGALEQQLADRITVGLWRLRRVPEIEAALVAHSHYSVLGDRSQEKVSAIKRRLMGYVGEGPILTSNEHYMAAKEREQECEAALNEDLPLFGATFVAAEPMLSRLTRIAAVTEASVYRAIKELERLQGERGKRVPETPVIEVYDAQPLPTPSREAD